MAILVGTEGDNFIFGTADSDAISGLGGNDSLVGGGGDDTVDGGTGNDTLAGSEALRFLPTAREVQVMSRGNWSAPRFEGVPAALSPQIDADGFTASWQSLELNHGLPRAWRGAEVDATRLSAAAFGFLAGHDRLALAASPHDGDVNILNVALGLPENEGLQHAEA